MWKPKWVKNVESLPVGQWENTPIFPQVFSLAYEMAGLLTYSFRKRPFSEPKTPMDWHSHKTAIQTVWNLQQRVLSRILTGFPFAVHISLQQEVDTKSDAKLAIIFYMTIHSMLKFKKSILYSSF